MLSDIINDIQHKQDKLQSLLESAKLELQAQNEKNFTQAEERLSEDLRASITQELDSKNAAKLGEMLDSLQSQNANDLRAAYTNIKNALDSSLASYNTKLEQSTQESLKSMREDFNTKIPTMLNEISQVLTPALLPHLEHLSTQTAEAKVEQKLQDESFLQHLPLDKISLDYGALSQNLASNASFKKLAQVDISKGVEEFCESSAGKSFLHKEAQAAITTALPAFVQEGEVIKMRYEAALRLQSLYIMGTQEYCIKLSHALQSPPSVQKPEKVFNNVLIAR